MMLVRSLPSECLHSVASFVTNILQQNIKDQGVQEDTLHIFIFGGGTIMLSQNAGKQTCACLMLCIIIQT